MGVANLHIGDGRISTIDYYYYRTGVHNI